jgi:hypothetical protein
MILIRATRKLISGSADLLSDGPVPQTGALGTWYANTVPLPYRGRSLVLFTAADTLLSVVAPGRSLRTTLPIFRLRAPRLLLRLGLPGAWIQERADDLAAVHIARAGARTIDRRVLGTMTDLSYHIWAEAEAVGSFDGLDLDHMEDRLAQVLLGALRSEGLSHGVAADAVAEMARDWESPLAARPDDKG